MSILENSVEWVFRLALILNALLFIPQAITLFRKKTAAGVSLPTFLGFLGIQWCLVLHGLIHHDTPLVIGYLLSLLTCGSVVILLVIYRHRGDDLLERCDVLEQIIALMPGHVYWVDRHGYYLGCNDGQAKSAGLGSRKDMVGKRNQDLPWNSHETVLPEVLDQINQDVIRTKQPKVIEEPATLPDGTQVIFLSHKVPLCNAKGQAVGMVGISIDITALKAAEKALKAEKAAVEAASQAKTEFLSNMKHDLRTPFAGLLGLSESMAAQETDPDKKQNLQYMTQSARALLDHLNEILELVQIENGQLPILEQSFDLHALIHSVSDMTLPSAQHKGLDFSLSVDHQLPRMVRGDALRTQRILMNVLANAIKFTANGFVTLTVRVNESAERMVCVDFTVEDSGIGIPCDQQEMIFERFNRLTSSYSGVYSGKGLGLKMVRQFLDEIGGQPYVTSELGKGTVFQVLIPYRLPLRQANPPNEEKISPLRKVTSTQPARQDTPPMSTSAHVDQAPPDRVLVVEDNPLAAKVVKNTLLGLNCAVDIAEDGKMALECVEQQAYDLIFMDIGLPDMSGFEVTQRIRAHRLTSIAQTPIVALTAHADTDHQPDCLEAPINRVLSKPLTSTQAIETLNRFIPRRQKSVHSTPEPTQRPTEKVIDLEYAKTLLGDDETVVKEMLTMLVASLPEEIVGLQVAYQRQDWETLKAIAHKLKGGASYCGTLRLKSACTALESYVKSGLTDRIPELYQQLLTEIDALKKAIHYQKFVD